MNFFGSLSHWILMLCDWIQSGLARRELPDPGKSTIDRQRKRIGWILFIVFWIPICTLALILLPRP